MTFIDKDTIKHELRGKVSAETLQEQIQILIDDGSIYTVANDNVYGLV